MYDIRSMENVCVQAAVTLVISESESILLSPFFCRSFWKNMKILRLMKMIKYVLECRRMLRSTWVASTTFVKMRKSSLLLSEMLRVLLNHHLSRNHQNLHPNLIKNKETTPCRHHQRKRNLMSPVYHVLIKTKHMPIRVPSKLISAPW